MPPYVRFPETQEITRRFWGLRPRNPTCGYISWKIGTLIFAWGNIVYGAVASILCCLIFVLHLSPATTSKQEILNMKEGKHSDPDMIERVYLNKSVAIIQSIIFFSFLFFSMWWFISWKLKKAAVDRELPKLKKYYVLMLILMAFAGMLTLWETEVVWSKAFLIDIPCIILQIMGLMFTHGYIATISIPGGDSAPPEDMNRIQFE